MGRTYTKSVGGSTSSSAKVETKKRTAGAVDSWTLDMVYENGFLFDSTRQFKFLSPKQMENGDRVKVTAERIIEE